LKCYVVMKCFEVVVEFFERVMLCSNVFIWCLKVFTECLRGDSMFRGVYGVFRCGYRVLE